MKGTKAAIEIDGVSIGQGFINHHFPTDNDNAAQFEKVLTTRINKIKGVLSAKGEEYGANNDRYHNFHTAARMDGETPEQALKGMWKKHLVSVFDLITWTETNPDRITEHLIDEKIGDSINYLILLEGLLRLRLSQSRYCQGSNQNSHTGAM